MGLRIHDQHPGCAGLLRCGESRLGGAGQYVFLDRPGRRRGGRDPHAAHPVRRSQGAGGVRNIRNRGLCGAALGPGVIATAARLRLAVVALAVIGLCGADAQAPDRTFTEADWANAETVTVTMVNYDFMPDRLSFRRGVAYRLHLENHGSEIHDFSAPE